MIVFFFFAEKVTKMPGLRDSLLEPLMEKWGDVHYKSSKWIWQPMFDFQDWFWNLNNAGLWFCGFCAILIPIYAAYLAIYLAIQARIYFRFT